MEEQPVPQCGTKNVDSSDMTIIFHICSQIRQPDVAQSLHQISFALWRFLSLGPNMGKPPLILHDGWLAMCAAALGPIDLIWEPLVAYRQHGHNTIGLRKDFQTSLQNLLHRIRDPDCCFYTAKMLLSILQELAKRVPDRVEWQYNLRTLKVICKGTWLALLHRSWSLPEWYTAFIGMTLYMRFYYLLATVKTVHLRR